jgi:hypothetical protein
VRHLLEQLLGGPLDPHQLALHVARRADAAPLAGECDEVVVAALAAAHPGETAGEDAAVQVAVDGLLRSNRKRPAGGREALLVHLVAVHRDEEAVTRAQIIALLK